MSTSKTILLVEDQEDDQFIAKRNLTRRWPGIKVLTANDGEEAIKVLSANQDHLPDLILLDINMPRMNGHEFLEAWSSQHGLRIPVVVMLTSSDQKSDRERSKQYDMVKDYILKPLDKATVEALRPMLEDC